MARDIEEFLRKAAERRNQQQRPGQPPPQRNPPRAEPPQQPSPVRNRLQPRGDVEPEIIEDIEVLEFSDRRPHQSKSAKSRPIGSGSKRSSSSSSRLTSQTSHSAELGKRVSQVKDKFERNVHRHLDHEISKVDATTSLKPTRQDSSRGSAGKKEKASPMVVGLRKMLARPETMGQAILAAEILKRPNFDD